MYIFTMLGRQKLYGASCTKKNYKLKWKRRKGKEGEEKGNVGIGRESLNQQKQRQLAQNMT